MAELSPILPLLYNPDVVGDLSTVITPPYDVIYPPDQEVYRQRSLYSAIRIELPVAEDGFDAYEQAHRLLRDWKESGVLEPHATPALFIHRQEYDLGGNTHTRTALLAGVRLEPWEARVVLPHERTFRGPKQDRLALLRATAVAPSSIFSLYEQPSAVHDVIAEVTEGPPLRTAEEGGVTHRLWAIDDERQVRAVVEAMRDRQLYIADGHHRYETALAYRDERREQDGTDSGTAYNYVAMSLVAFDDPGLVVLPTHRLVHGLPGETVHALSAKIASTFTVESVAEYEPTERAVTSLLESDATYAFLLYDGTELLRVTGDNSGAAALPQDRSEAWRQLDLAALHELVLGRALGISADRLEAHVRYTRDVAGAFERVDSGEEQLAAFVRPTGVAQLRAVADASDKMPQKSTYFYPKFPAGLAINQLDVVLTMSVGAGT